MTSPASRQAYPNLNRFLVGFITYVDTPELDPQLMIDDAIRVELTSPGYGNLPAVAAELDELIERCSDEETAEKVLDKWHRTGLPDGTSYLEWLRVTHGVVHEALDGRALMPPPVEFDSRDGLVLPRASRFTDLQTANMAATEALRAREHQVRAWAAEQGGWPRQHLYLDLGREIGRVVTNPDRESVAGTAVVVVMTMDDESGNPFVLTSYPEIPLDTGWRDRFPDLCHWFGGWFNQDCGNVWNTVTEVNKAVRDPARSRVREQLRDLLTLVEADMTTAVEACGSYVLPSRMRPWMVRTLWRLDAYDWLGDRNDGHTEGAASPGQEIS